jgi:ketosteroid isomerase-like protein
VVRLFAIVDSSSWSDLDEVFDAGAVYDRPGYPSIIGFDRVHRFYEHERVIASGEHRLEQLVVEPPFAACWGIFVGKLKTGVPVEERFADTYRFAGTRIVHRRSFFYRPAV